MRYVWQKKYKKVRWSISRVLYLVHRLSGNNRMAIIRLALSLLISSSNLPSDSRTRTPVYTKINRKVAVCLEFGLASNRACRAMKSLNPCGELLPHLFTLTDADKSAKADYFL